MAELTLSEAIHEGPSSLPDASELRAIERVRGNYRQRFTEAELIEAHGVKGESVDCACGETVTVYPGEDREARTLHHVRGVAHQAYRDRLAAGSGVL